MDHKEFANFLVKIKEKKISNKQFADYIGYNPATISCYATGKKKLPKILGLVIDSLRLKESMGIDLKNIIHMGLGNNGK